MTIQKKLQPQESCDQVNALLSRYQDHELDSPGREKIELHLRQCPDCQQELQRLEKITASIKQLPAVETRPFFTEQVMGRIMTNPKQHIAKSPVLPWLQVVYSAVFILFLVLGFLFNGGLSQVNPDREAQAESRQDNQDNQDNYIITVLAHSQDLNLINVQETTLALLNTNQQYNRNGAPDEK